MSYLLLKTNFLIILAARRLSGMANLLDLGAVFGEKIRGRFVQSALISKELQSKFNTTRKVSLQVFQNNNNLLFFSGYCSPTQRRGTKTQIGSRQTSISSL